jgi:6,7-dimethyl-8-ribityllumazine synthase
MSLHTPNPISNEGIQLPTDAFVVIVKTEWNESIINELELGCQKVLDENNVAHKSIVVPGAVEIPFAIKHFWESTNHKKPLAFISLGCVIRGGTPHFDFVCKLLTEGVLQLNLLLPVPTIFGVLTVDNETQAHERLGGVHGHKGEEAAWAAIKMISLSHSLQI